MRQNAYFAVRVFVRVMFRFEFGFEFEFGRGFGVEFIHRVSANQSRPGFVDGVSVP
jgi:hypothetical protein